MVSNEKNVQNLKSYFFLIAYKTPTLKIEDIGVCLLVILKHMYIKINFVKSPALWKLFARGTSANCRLLFCRYWTHFSCSSSEICEPSNTGTICLNILVYVSVGLSQYGTILNSKPVRISTFYYKNRGGKTKILWLNEIKIIIKREYAMLTGTN